MIYRNSNPLPSNLEKKTSNWRGTPPELHKKKAPKLTQKSPPLSIKSTDLDVKNDIRATKPTLQSRSKSQEKLEFKIGFPDKIGDDFREGMCTLSLKEFFDERASAC